MSKSFNLEAFKNGKKAITRSGRVATFVGICNECRASNRLVAHIQGYDSVFTYFASGVYPDEDNRYSMYDLVSMVSRHQHLIDSYDPEDTWQFKKTIKKVWDTLQNTDPQWLEDYDYRLHPHNDLIKAWKKGAKIKAYIVGDWVEEPNPDWYEDTKYRIKPSTKTVYEYIVKNAFGTWSLHTALIEEDEAEDYFKQFKGFVKTGRSWEVEV